MPRLSTLSRGIGEIKHSACTGISIKLDPTDVSVGIWRPRGVLKKEYPSIQPLSPFMPPPGFFQSRSPRLKREASLPKTFSTKKGALVLYSEDFAQFHNHVVQTKDDHNGRGKHHLNIKTADLTLAIARYEQNQNKYNRFFKKNSLAEIKPGHSARRHVAAWHLSHPEVNLRGSLGSKFSRKLEKRGRQKRIIQTSLTVFPPPYYLPKSLGQIKQGLPINGIVKEKTIPTVTQVVETLNGSLKPSLVPRKLAPIENSVKSREWICSVNPQFDRDIGNLSSASTDFKFTRTRLPPIFKNTSSEGSRLTKETSGSQITSGSTKKKVRIQLEPVILPGNSSPTSETGLR